MLVQIKVKRCLGGWGELGVVDMLAAWKPQTGWPRWGGGEELREEIDRAGAIRDGDGGGKLERLRKREL